MKAVTVTQVNEYIAKKLRDDYQLKILAVEGEISGLSFKNGNWYFTLKDINSAIRCNIWGSNASKIDMNLVKDGKQVIVIASISPYAKGGYYSLSVTHVEVAGEGALMAEFNRLKAKLQAEGLFDTKYKKPIPAFPVRIGVITSESGAAVRDIIKIVTAKNNFTDIVIFPTLVQGAGAPQSICHNIRLANSLAQNGYHIDTLIVGRGGGSVEHLAAFNDENVARAIFASEIPVISAVGHETDFSISDFVADLRAETPTAAANAAVMDTFKLREDISQLTQTLTSAIRQKAQSQRMLLESRTELLYSNMKNKITQTRSAVDKAMIVIRENDPRNIFNKGYAAVTDENGKVVPDVESVVTGKAYKVVMRDGSFTAHVTEKRKDQ